MKNLMLKMAIELHSAIKVYCAKNNIGMCDYVIALIKKDLTAKGEIKQ